MLVPESDQPLSNTTPLSDLELYALSYHTLEIDGAAIEAKAAADCVVAPESMPSLKLAQEAQQFQQSQQMGLTRNTPQLNQQVQQASADGPIFSPGDYSNAPQVVPLVTMPSAVGRPAVPAFPRVPRRVNEPGTPWGSISAADTSGPCATGAYGSLRERLGANPLGTLLIYVGLGAIVYAALKK